MPKYKIGDVAALFPNPTKPKTDSGKKIQALFNDFYNKSSKPSKKWTQQNQVQGKEKQVEEKNESVIEKEPKKKKRKFKNSNVPDSTETTEVTHQVTKKPKLDSSAPSAPFPRSKSRKDKNAGSFLAKNTTKEEFSGDENFSPKAKMHSQAEEMFPRRNKQMSGEEEIPRKKKRNKKKKNSQRTSQEEDLQESNLEETDFTGHKAEPEKESPKKKKKKKETPQEEELPDFLKLFPGKEQEESSKVVFRMKKKRDIPSARDIFQKQGEGGEKGKRKLHTVLGESEERRQRTLFVGNLPVNTTRKSLEKLFSPFGSLESCRLRGAVPTKCSIPRKIAEIKNKFHSGLNSRIAYVVLKDKEAAQSALTLSGVLIDGHHIVVDQASAQGEKKCYDETRSIFVGNLPFGIKDEDLWCAFVGCGEIEAVRVIRDKETGAGKGFGYVSFQKLQGKENALSLTNLEIENRRLRISSVEKGKKKKQAQPPPPWKNSMMRIAKKKKKDRNTNSRKTLSKLMKSGKQQHQKKKVASIFKKFF